MKIYEILETHTFRRAGETFRHELFGSEFVNDIELIATNQGAKKTAEMWNHHKRVEEIVEFLKHNLGALGPHGLGAARALFDIRNVNETLSDFNPLTQYKRVKDWLTDTPENFTKNQKKMIMMMKIAGGPAKLAIRLKHSSSPLRDFLRRHKNELQGDLKQVAIMVEKNVN